MRRFASGLIIGLVLAWAAVALSQGGAGATGNVSVNFDTAVTAGDGWGCMVLALTAAPSGGAGGAFVQDDDVE